MMIEFEKFSLLHTNINISLFTIKIIFIFTLYKHTQNGDIKGTNDEQARHIIQDYDQEGW